MKTTFFLDLDNTLLNNDIIKIEIKKSLENALGDKEALHFWFHHDSFREYNKLVDFPNIIREYCSEKHKNTCDLTLNNIFFGINFENALYPKALDVIKHLKSFGEVNIFTEGDKIYQKCKVEKSGVEALVNTVFLFPHKLDNLEEMKIECEKINPVFIDDKVSNLEGVHTAIPNATTIRVLQGHYSNEVSKDGFTPDKEIPNIGALLEVNFS